MSSLMILAASVFEISCRKARRQTEEDPTPSPPQLPSVPTHCMIGRAHTWKIESMVFLNLGAKYTRGSYN